ncbi:MAG: hypothetical protein K8Q97_01285 [Candidatus Andersenbacteria bacterium]|nr:hypothetical protein [Candidatus Andersenbacteria bacterium]
MKQFFPFLIVAVLITLPWFLHPGYLLLLDWTGIPHPHISLDPTGGIAGTPIQIAWTMLSTVIESSFAQKILVLAMLMLAGGATYRLTYFLLSNKLASIIAGIFMVTNAFVFNRLQMGHIYLLYAYALTPYAIYLVLCFLQQPSSKKALQAGIGCSAVILLSIHHTILLPILIILFAWHTQKIQHYSRTQYIALLGPYIATLLAILAVAYINPASQLATISLKDIAVFAPRAQCTPQLATDTVFLSSQWRNPHAVSLPCSNKIIFYASNIFLLGVMLIGAWNNKKLFIGAIILVLLTDIPFIPAMRDSAKYLADLALIEAALLAYGIVHLQKKYGSVSSILILLCTLLAGSSIYWGLSNTITPKIYPQSWYAFNQTLAKLPEKPRVLFLPWHLYMPFDFTNQATIADPAKLFFTNGSIIQGDNLEMRQGDAFIVTESTSPESQEINHALAQISTPDFSSSFLKMLKEQHISYIALAHGSPEEALYKNTFKKLPYVSLLVDSPGLTIWQFGE